MTIQLNGHIESVKRGHLGHVDVEIQTERSVCNAGITLSIPAEQAGEWLVGNFVQITAYAYKPTPDSAPLGEQEKKG
jgi:hypothetical protein